MSPETKPKVVAMIVASAIIMQQIDATVITTALPQMAVSLNSDPVTLSVAVTAYLLSVAVFIPVSGWAADRFGGRTVFRAAIALFTLSTTVSPASTEKYEWMWKSAHMTPVLSTETSGKPPAPPSPGSPLAFNCAIAPSKSRVSISFRAAPSL